MRWFLATQLIYVGDDFEYDTGVGLSTKYFFLNGERVATRSIYYDAELASVPAWVYRWLTPLAPAVFPALVGVLALALLALLAMGLGVPLPAWAAAPGVALLACALVAYPQSVARAVIGGGGDPEWHGGHSKGILIYGNDPLGSTRVVIDATGATVETRDYAPFGKTIKETGAFKLKNRFTSQPYDDLVELYNYGARMYDPRWGRFVSPDELVQGFDSQGLNPYAYVLNQPTSLVDPSGRYADFPQGEHFRPTAEQQADAQAEHIDLTQEIEQLTTDLAKAKEARDNLPPVGKTDSPFTRLRKIIMAPFGHPFNVARKVGGLWYETLDEVDKQRRLKRANDKVRQLENDVEVKLEELRFLEERYRLGPDGTPLEPSGGPSQPQSDAGDGAPEPAPPPRSSPNTTRVALPGP